MISDGSPRSVLISTVNQEKAMRSTVDSRMAFVLSLLQFAAACPLCFAQADPAEKRDVADQGWVAAGTITGYDSHIYSLAFGPGPILVSGDANFVRVWDVETKQEQSFYKPPLKYATTITAITYSPHDDWVSFRGLREYHLACGEKWLKNGRPIDIGFGVRGESLSPLAIASDGKTYALRSQAAKKYVVDVIRHEFDVNPSRRMRVASCRGHEGDVDCAAFSPDLKLLATGSQDKTVRLWETATGEQLAVLTGHTDAVSAVEFSPNGDFIATGGKDGCIRFWDVGTRTEKGMTQGKSGVRCLSFAPDSKSLASGDEEGILRILSVEDSAPKAIMTDHAGTVFCVAFNRKGDLLASGGQDKVIRLWKNRSP